jgi:four helix bundle protein
MSKKLVITSYRDLAAWQKAMELLVMTYRLCKKFPSEEQFVLSAQLRRAVVSIPSNIAEGYGRSSRIDYVRFLKIASGSLYEVETQLEAAKRLKFINDSDFNDAYSLALEIERILSGLIRSLNK